MKFVNINQWVNFLTGSKSHPPKAISQRGGREPCMHSSNGVCGAKVNEVSGRAMEPRYLYNCGSSWRGNTPMNVDVLACAEDSSAIVKSGYAIEHRRGLRTGHETTGLVRELGRARCLHRGQSAREERLNKLPGDCQIQCFGMAGERMSGAADGIGGPATSEGIREGLLAVLVANSTDVLRMENESVGK